MGEIKDKYASVFRDFSTDGVESSGDHEPVKSEIREIGPMLETAIGNAALGALVDVVYATRAELDADLAHAAETVALVYADATETNNDLYIKSGASGSGSWTLTSALHDIIGTLSQPYVDNAQAAQAAAEAASIAAIPRIMLEGDSIMAQNHARSGFEFIGTAGRGEIVWARSFFPFFAMDQWEDPADVNHSSKGCNVAVGGSWTSDVIARLDETMNVAPDIVCLSIGINNINGTATAAATMADIETICEFYIGLGKTVLLANLRPVSATYGTGWGDGGAKITELLALNTLIADYAAATPEVHLVDLMAAYSDGASPPRPRAGETYDGLHPSRTGAFWGGVLGWLPVLRKVIKSLVVYRPSGANIIGNGVFAGAGGLLGAGFTGDVASGWRMLMDSSSGSLSASAVASKNAADEQVVTITPGGDAWERVQILRSSGGAVMEEFKWYKGLMRVRFNASAYWRSIHFQFDTNCQAMGTTEFTTSYIGNVGEDIELLLETPLYQAEAGGETGTIAAYVLIDGASPDPMVFTVLEAYAAEVPDPNPLHGFDLSTYSRPV